MFFYNGFCYRFNTHIDYVFLNKEFQDIYQLETVLHHPNQAHLQPSKGI